jgi:HTH-type transcriptional regulator/antitoxin HipB
MHANSQAVAAQIGSVIQRERNRLELTQDELAFTAGVSTRAVHQVENGKATSRLDTLVALLEAVGLTLVAEPSGEVESGSAN